MSHIFPRLYQYKKGYFVLYLPNSFICILIDFKCEWRRRGVISWYLLPPWLGLYQLATHLLLPTPTVLDPWTPRLRRLNSISHPPRKLLSQVLRGLMEVTLGCSDNKSRCSWQTLEEFSECPGWDVFFQVTEWSFSSHHCSLILERGAIGWVPLPYS